MCNIEKIKSMFESDTTCAEVLKSTKLIEFSSEFKYAYIWNDKKLLYDKMVCDQYRFVISKILINVFEQKKQLYYKSNKKNNYDEENEENEEDEDDEEQIKQEIKKLKANRQWFIKTKNLLETSHKINSIINMCGDMINVDCNDIYNNDKNLIPIKHGMVVDLRTTKTRKRTKTDYFTYELDVEIADEIDHANKFFSAIMNDDKQTILRFQEILGYCISKWTFLIKYFIFWGETGNNGKSELLSIMNLIFGPFLCTSISEGVFTDMNNKNDNAPTPHLIQMLGKILEPMVKFLMSY
mgnify:FL=1